MEQRLRRLEGVFPPDDQLRLMVTHVADQQGLDAGLLYLEALIVLREIGKRRLSLDTFATETGISPDELTRLAEEFRVYWQRIA